MDKKLYLDTYDGSVCQFEEGHMLQVPVYSKWTREEGHKRFDVERLRVVTSIADATPRTEREHTTIDIDFHRGNKLEVGYSFEPHAAEQLAAALLTALYGHLSETERLVSISDLLSCIQTHDKQKD